MAELAEIERLLGNREFLREAPFYECERLVREKQWILDHLKEEEK